jgi:DUF4097 and DUF4098 domain-containing protein YvlB
MKHDHLIYAAAVALCLGSLAVPSRTHAAKKRDFNINTKGDATSCADLHVTSSSELSQVNSTFTLSKGEAPILEINALDRGQIHVRAWDRAEYSVETCKVAVADTRSTADTIARGIAVNHVAGNLSVSGPTVDNGDWIVVFFIHAPKDATLSLETTNGPIDVKGINGNVRLRAANGPIAVSDCGGNVDAQTKNGPIALSGDRGDVHLTAENGPIALNFSSDTWNGSKLEARTVNGPLAVHMPDTFRSAMRLEMSGHSPISCQAAVCRNGWTDASRGIGRVLQMNGASEIIRLTTENGPVALSSGESRSKKMF